MSDAIRDAVLREGFHAVLESDTLGIERDTPLTDALILAASKWWYRTPSIGTRCVVCNAFTHFDMGIDDIEHRHDCPIPMLRKKGL